MQQPALGTLSQCTVAAALVVFVAACGPTTTAPLGGEAGSGAGDISTADGLAEPSDTLKVVATTTLVGDVVSRVGGEDIELTVIMPPGVDPHGYEPTPADVAAVADADVVFLNGLGLEEFIEPLVANAGGTAQVVAVSSGIETIELAGGHTDHDAAGELHDVDPHVWFDPANVAAWTDSIQATLGELHPGSTEAYFGRARDFKEELDELDRWIEEQVAAIPPERRRLVTDHQVLGYFARRYGFEQVGSLHGFSTLSEPSAAELAHLMDTINELAVPAVFVGTTVNPTLAEMVAHDAGTRVVEIYTGSLGEPGGPAGTYLGFMRHDVSAIVEALR